MKRNSMLLLISLFGLITTFVSCSKDDDDDNNSNAPSAKYYFNGSLGNQSFKLEFTNAGNVIPGTNSFASIGVDSSESGWGGFLYEENAAGDVTNSWGVDFQTVVSLDGDFDETEFNSLFSTGDYPFISIDILGPDGVAVKGQADSLFYTSVPPPGQSQPASSRLNVSSVRKNPASGLIPANVELKGTVKVTVWVVDDMGTYTGSSSALDASFSLIIEKD